MENEREAQSKIETQAVAWAAELGKLAAKADREVAKVKKEYYEEIERLRGKIEAKVRQWGPEIEGLKEKAGTMESDARRAIAELYGTMDAHLRALRPEIEAVVARADSAKAEARRMMEELRERRQAARAKAKQLTDAGDEAWGEIKVGVEKAWHELRVALESAVAKFK